MSVKSKKMRKAARTAAMSALIVSAIVGTTVIASAADNLSITDSAAFGRVGVSEKAGVVGGVVNPTGIQTIGGLKVSSGSLYVDQNLTVTGKSMNAQGANAWVTGGSLIVGMKSDGASVGGKTLTVDNMTIDGGLVSVTNGGTLTTAGDIDINAGELRMSGTYSASNVPVNASGSFVRAKALNINAAGTLHVVGGQQNVIEAGAVNLKGGTINVASKADSGLTIVAAGAAAGAGGNWASLADAAAKGGSMVVASGAKFNSYGGTIKANLISKGDTHFKSGTTTTDNLTVAAGTTLIEGNATVNVIDDKVKIASVATLEMRGGTLRVAGGAGVVNVDGFLKSTAGINTVDASVAVSASGKVDVSGGSTLTITKDLNIASGGHVVAASGSGSASSLILNGKLTTEAANSIQVGLDNNAAGLGSLTIGHSSLTADTVYASSIKIGNGTGAGDGALNGTLIVKDYAGATLDVAGADATAIKGKTTGGVLGADYALNNVVMWGKELTNNGQVVVATTDGTKKITAGVNVAVTGTGNISVAITAPSITAPNGAIDLKATGALNLIGAGRGDASNKTTTLNSVKLSVSGAQVSVNGGATLNTGILDMVTGTSVNVINSTANFGTLKATGGTIFVDPAYVTIGNIDGTFQGKLFDSSGSIVTIGGNSGWMDKPMADARFTFGDTTKATLGIAATDTITIGLDGVVAVDPTITFVAAATAGGTPAKYTFTKVDGTTDVTADRSALGAFYAGDNTLTVLDVSGLNGDPVFNIVAGTDDHVNIVNGAKLHVTNLTVKGVKIFTMSDGTAVELKNGNVGTYVPGNADAGWAGKNLIQPDRMLTNVGMSASGTLTAKAALASNALGMSTEFNDLMGGVWGNALNSTHSGSAGIRFVSRAASTDFGLSADMAAKTIEGAAQMAAVAGVQGVTMGAANAATSAIATRTSFAQPLMDKTKAVAMHVDSDGTVSLDSGLNAGNGMKNGFALWIMPLYQSNSVWGMDAGNFKSGYTSDLGGVALGADYTINDMFRFGAALNIGAGYSESTGDFNSTDNSFNFWGVNLYGGWTMNNFGVTADVGYTGNYNKVEQEVPMSLQVPNLKSDINSSALTAGVKAEYKFETSVMDIIPHVGVRYMGLTTDEYSVKGGGTVFKVDQEHQTIWTFPIGVTLSKTMETGSGWMFKPQLDLAVIPAAGDVEARSKSRIPGAPGTAEAKMQVVDHVTFDGGVGFDFSNENLSFGLNYNIQASEHRTGHGVFGTVRYEF